MCSSQTSFVRSFIHPLKHFLGMYHVPGPGIKWWLDRHCHCQKVPWGWADTLQVPLAPTWSLWVGEEGSPSEAGCHWKTLGNPLNNLRPFLAPDVPMYPVPTGQWRGWQGVPPAWHDFSTRVTSHYKQPTHAVHKSMSLNLGPTPA